MSTVKPQMIVAALCALMTAPMAVSTPVVGSGAISDNTSPAIAAAVQASAPAIVDARVNPAVYRPSEDKSITIPRSADGLFYVNAVVGGQTIRFLVDTGANITVLTQQDAQKLSLAAVSSRRGNVIQTVGGSTMTTWAHIPQMKIAHKPIADIEAAVIGGGLPVSLLGQNALSRLEGLTFAGDELLIH